MSTNNSSQQLQHISHLITTNYFWKPSNKVYSLVLTKFKAIDFISDTFHTYITTLSQQLQEHISTNSHSNYSDRSSTTLLITNFHNIMQELVKIIHHILSQHTSSTTNINIILCDRSSTNLSQRYHNILHHIFNKHSTNSFTTFFATFFATFFTTFFATN